MAMSDFKVDFLRDAVPLINRIDEGKLGPLTQRIAASIVKAEIPFSVDDQKKRLERSLEFNSNEVDLVIKGLDELLRESSYFGITQEELQRKMLSLGVEPHKAKLLADVWNKVMPTLSDSLKNVSIMPQLNHISYNVSVKAGEDFASQEKLVRGQIHLGLTSDDRNEDLDVEFSREELFHFHKQLSRIQMQLDAMANK